MADQDIQPEALPRLNLPKSDSTVEVCIINTTTDIVVPAGAFVQPVQPGHETMNVSLCTPCIIDRVSLYVHEQDAME